MSDFKKVLIYLKKRKGTGYVCFNINDLLYYYQHKKGGVGFKLKHSDVKWIALGTIKIFEEQINN